jgi:DNA-binding MarR family transcriptional regulator
MKEIDSYKEDDFRYKEYELNEKELKKISDYTNYQFKASKTRLLIIYSFMGDIVAAQIQENIIKDFSPEEIKKLFKKIPE